MKPNFKSHCRALLSVVTVCGILLSAGFAQSETIEKTLSDADLNQVGQSLNSDNVQNVIEHQATGDQPCPTHPAIRYDADQKKCLCNAGYQETQSADGQLACVKTTAELTTQSDVISQTPSAPSTPALGTGGSQMAGGAGCSLVIPRN